MTAAMLSGMALAHESAADPRIAKLAYEGSGLSEHAPEYGEVWFTFSVGCQASAEAVRQSIEAVSGKVWNSIVSKVSPTSNTEVRKTYWGSIGGISEQPGSQVRTVQPVRPQGGQPAQAGSAKRFDVCTGKEIALNAKVATIFSGSQRFGVRSDDMDWIEGLARTVKALPQDNKTNTVKVAAGGIKYEVTENLKRNMLSDTLGKARLEATGPHSKFESDRKTLRFTSAYYLGHRFATPPQYTPVVGSPVARGQAPKVTLELPMVYTIYSEAADLVDQTSSRTEGVRSDYEIVGKAVVDANYAETSVSLGVACQASKSAVLTAIAPYSKDLVTELRNYQGAKPASETDKLTNNEIGNPTSYFPYQPVQWDESKAGTPATKYLNTCTQEVVDAPASGQASDLPAYWQVSQSLSLRSKAFDRLLTFTEGLQSKYNRATSRTDEVRVSVGDAYGDVTEATKRQLAIKARESATAYILNPHGPLAQDAKAHGFRSAHLVGIRVGQPRVAQMERAPAFRAMAAAPGAAPQADELTVDVVHKDNGERPEFRMLRHYAFDFQVITQDYLRKPAPAPLKPGTQDVL